jgi:ADP-ribosylglycohydrolase
VIGALIGDIVGSVYEWHPIKTEVFPLFSQGSRFTDDTVLSVAVADAILNQLDYGQTIWEYGNKYPQAGYGSSFRSWLQKQGRLPYNSYGNGSAMRVSPVGWAFNSVEEVLAEAGKTAAVTHNHPEGIKGAQAVALAVYLARQGCSKSDIKSEIEQRFAYDLGRTLSQIRPGYAFDVSCQGSVPESIIAFLESHDYVDALRKAVSLGGDSDTMACIAGSIAQAYYRYIPEDVLVSARRRLDPDLLQVVDAFSVQYCC